jgi:D-serine deaminase-like pyridoxal phosphate-dependent protein
VDQAVARLSVATAHLDPPLAVVDLAALRSNAADLVRRANGVPIRIASKSVRCRAVLAEAFGLGGFAGIMAYSLREAIWLARDGETDILLGYPTADVGALGQLDDELAARIVLMVDSPEHVALLRGHARVPVRVCLDVDASLRIGPIHPGVRRSPVHTVAEARLAAETIEAAPDVTLVGLMFYDAQIAGLPDSSPAVRLVKRRSAAELADRRAAVVTAVSAVAPIILVNGGGTGSLHLTGRDPSLTELAAGSGLYGPTLFDEYRAFHPQPAAAYFVTSITRRPSRKHAVAYSGGYIASGPPGWSRVPKPTWPAGLELLGSEGAGEVQTPLRGRAASTLELGDRVWFRHAKAGELCERFNELHLVDSGGGIRVVPTYRGEGKNFG